MQQQIEETRPKSVVDVEDFNSRVLGAYAEDLSADSLVADLDTARSIIPGGTGSYRDFSYIGTEIPIYDPNNCVGCMECVIECPDTAILGKVIEPENLQTELDLINDPLEKLLFETRFTDTQKFGSAYEKKGEKGGLFGIFIDPTKCKGCAECVDACGDHQALSMIPNLIRLLNSMEKRLTFIVNCQIHRRNLLMTDY